MLQFNQWVDRHDVINYPTPPHTFLSPLTSYSSHLAPPSVLFCTVHYCIISYHTIPHHTILHYTTVYDSLSHPIISFLPHLAITYVYFTLYILHHTYNISQSKQIRSYFKTGNLISFFFSFLVLFLYLRLSIIVIIIVLLAVSADYNYRDDTVLNNSIYSSSSSSSKQIKGI